MPFDNPWSSSICSLVTFLRPNNGDHIAQNNFFIWSSKYLSGFQTELLRFFEECTIIIRVDLPISSSPNVARWYAIWGRFSSFNNLLAARIKSSACERQASRTFNLLSGSLLFDSMIFVFEFY